MGTVFATPLNSVQPSTLAQAFAAGGTAVQLAAGTGVRFGNPTASAPVRVPLSDRAGLDAYGRVNPAAKVNTFKASGRAGDALTGLTLESGTAQSYAAGDWVYALLDGAALVDLHGAVNALETKVQSIQPGTYLDVTLPPYNVGTG